MEDHVVTQVIETELVIGRVSDGTAVGTLAILAGHARQDHTDRHIEGVIQTSHPFGVATRKVIVNGHHVHRTTGQRIEIGRQGRDQGFAFAGAHFGNLALVQYDAADHLLVEMTHAEHTLAGFTHHGKSFGQQIVEGLTSLVAVTEFGGLGTQGLIAQGSDATLQLIDGIDRLVHALQQAIITAAEHRLDDACG